MPEASASGKTTLACHEDIIPRDHDGMDKTETMNRISKYVDIIEGAPLAVATDDERDLD